LRLRMAAYASDRRFEEAAELRDRLDALDTVGRRLARLRSATSRSGVLLAADIDDRFVQAFACAGGRVVARRRLPRAGDAMLEAEPLAAALREAMARPASPLAADQADAAAVVAAAFARPGRDVIAIPIPAGSLHGAALAVAARRSRVPLRR
jgi:excinuclease UvrABC nuclease subunit